MTNLRLGINLWGQAASWPEVLATARRVDALGYDSLWTWDHLGTPLADSLEPSRPLLGPPDTIAARLREYVEADFTTVIVEVPAPYDVETLERLIGEVKPLVDAGRA